MEVAEKIIIVFFEIFLDTVRVKGFAEHLVGSDQFLLDQCFQEYPCIDHIFNVHLALQEGIGEGKVQQLRMLDAVEILKDVLVGP